MSQMLPPLAGAGTEGNERCLKLIWRMGQRTKIFWVLWKQALTGIPLIVSKSGWSKQGGYELYLRDGTRG